MAQRRFHIARSFSTAALLALLLVVGVLYSSISLAKDSPDVRVIIDISGSMKKNDPNNLRRPALELLVKLLPKGAKAGVWTFGQYVNNLVPHGAVDNKWRRTASEKAKTINSIAMFTDIGKALDVAGDDFHLLKPGYRTSIILLTDGVVDISKDAQKNRKARAKILRDTLKHYVGSGVTIHTIALSRFADQELLEQLAIDTNGIAAVAESADELMKIFLRAFDDAAPAEQVPLKGNSFMIDSSIEEFTALIFRNASERMTVLVGPNGDRYEYADQGQDIKWHSTDEYDLITMQNPERGEWKVEADLDPENRVTVVSDLSLEVSRLPRNIYLGNLPEFKASLLEDGRVIKKADFLKIIDVSVSVRSRSSKKRWKKSLSKGKAVPSDGSYMATLSMLKKPGPYEFVIDVDGKTFQRSNKQLVSVREAMELTVREMLSEEKPTYLISVYSRNSHVDMAQTSVLCRISYPEGKTAIKNLGRKGERRWQLAFDELEEVGIYKVEVEIDGKYSDGTAFTIKPMPKSFGFKVDVVAETVIEEPEPELQDEPEPSPIPEETSPVPELPVEEEPPMEEFEEEGSNLFLYIGIGLGNIIIAIIVFFAYRTVTGSKKSEILEDDADDNADIDLGEELAPASDVPTNDDILGEEDIDEGLESFIDTSDADEAEDEEIEDDELDGEEFTEIEIEEVEVEVEVDEEDLDDADEEDKKQASVVSEEDDDDDFDMDDIIDIGPEEDD